MLKILCTIIFWRIREHWTTWQYFGLEFFNCIFIRIECDSLKDTHGRMYSPTLEMLRICFIIILILYILLSLWNRKTISRCTRDTRMLKKLFEYLWQKNYTCKIKTIHVLTLFYIKCALINSISRRTVQNTYLFVINTNKYLEKVTLHVC